MDRCILLVTDHADDVGRISRLLQQEGSVGPLHVVTDGAAVIARLAGADPAGDRSRDALPLLVLLDLSPSGLEALRWVRQQAGLAHLPVVVMATAEQYGELRDAYDLGANAYLIKPVAASDLSEVVKTANLYRLLLHGAAGASRSG